MHTVEIQHLRSGGWGATCTCGWVPAISPEQDDVMRAARSHAEGVTIVEVPVANTNSNHAHGARRHERLRAELLRQPGNSLLFRAVCSCGWKSEPVTMGRVVLVWERHVDDDEGTADS